MNYKGEKFGVNIEDEKNIYHEVGAPQRTESDALQGGAKKLAFDYPCSKIENAPRKLQEFRGAL